MLTMIFTNINSIKGPDGGILLPAGEKKPPHSQPRLEFSKKIKKKNNTNNNLTNIKYLVALVLLGGGGAESPSV